MDWIIALVALTAMEIVLGIDNIVFLAILADKLPEEQQAKARTIGLAAALVMRILLLLGISWIMGLTTPLFDLASLGLKPEWFGEHGAEMLEVSGRDIIMLVGGLFLIGHSVKEVHENVEGAREGVDGIDTQRGKVPTFTAVITQIALMDIIFSLDSVITAVGMVEADKVIVMIVAIVLAIGVMMFAAGPISRFVSQHPTVKILALSFLILIGVMLVAEAIGTHINKGYVYFAMAFSLVVELINMRVRPVPLPDTVPANTTPQQPSED
ncbi:MAG: TerC family protein [Planctomycetaceae bacterium]|nr:TerC family protein [Planctomycetaceae bacterium]